MSDTERRRALELARAAERGTLIRQVVAISALILLILRGQRERSLALLVEARLANLNNPTVLSLFAFCNVLAGGRKWAGKRSWRHMRFLLRGW
ncbi:hypothetical protein P9272_03730 [Mesorhizobium sp. WSM4976]|uniref:hypothetical protein n=1 Tax=Mesorhizobium sp. WSM4976 TaxID=3038549 RepID=UPI0024169D95|nr:hypothetical protein [Mesorhizobium sp. WSM4976]MDG4892699.1 hypothetical protein [Mesorhizobium sp. WSM4976]